MFFKILALLSVALAFTNASSANDIRTTSIRVTDMYPVTQYSDMLTTAKSLDGRKTTHHHQQLTNDDDDTTRQDVQQTTRQDVQQTTRQDVQQTTRQDVRTTERDDGQDISLSDASSTKLYVSAMGAMIFGMLVM